MTIADTVLTKSRLVLLLIGKREGVTIELPANMTIAALQNHLRELAEWLD